MQLHLAFRRCRHKKGTGMLLDCDADAIVCKASLSQADLWMHAWPNSLLPVHDTQIRLCENMPGASEFLPVIVQDVRSKQILMFAWTDAEAFFFTETTRHAHYYSRSRKKLWKKGEESGNAQIVRSISSLYRDDWQCLIFEVSQRKAACHAGYRTCFYRRIESDGLLTVVGERVFDPALVYKK